MILDQFGYVFHGMMESFGARQIASCYPSTRENCVLASEVLIIYLIDLLIEGCLILIDIG